LWYLWWYWLWCYCLPHKKVARVANELVQQGTIESLLHAAVEKLREAE
jgi:hypothetical protein